MYCMTHKEEVFLDFDLPDELIAQYPAEKRDQSRLLVVDRMRRSIEHRMFADLPEILRPNDLLILNDSRVLPARLFGTRQATGGRWQGVFLKELEQGLWQMLSQTRGRLRPGEWLTIAGGVLRLRVVEQLADRSWLMSPEPSRPARELLNACGAVPIPPYIRKGRDEPIDRERYQTIFARREGAVAAPTAGLHFSPEVFARLKSRGVDWGYVTLHVGWGTFAPLPEGDYRRHKLHREWGELPAATARAVRLCRKRSGRVVAVGTTSVRVLETAAVSQSREGWVGETDLFIYPPYCFQAVDALITNFHLPRTSLLLLVGAFAGSDLIRQAYETAVRERYRFFSYGDAMLIL